MYVVSSAGSTLGSKSGPALDRDVSYKKNLHSRRASEYPDIYSCLTVDVSFAILLENDNESRLQSDELLSMVSLIEM